MEVKIAGINAITKKANANGVALMVCAVEKVGLEMDVMALLGGLLITNVWLKRQNVHHPPQFINVHTTAIVEVNLKVCNPQSLKILKQ